MVDSLQYLFNNCRISCSVFIGEKNHHVQKLLNEISSFMILFKAAIKKCTLPLCNYSFLPKTLFYFSKTFVRKSKPIQH